MAAQGQPAPAGTSHSGKAYTFNKVAEGVYHVVGTGNLAVVGNSVVIVNEQEVVLVDDHVSPAAEWVLLDELRAITDKPVRYVINTLGLRTGLMLTREAANIAYCLLLRLLGGGAVDPAAPYPHVNRLGNGRGGVTSIDM